MDSNDGFITGDDKIIKHQFYSWLNGLQKFELMFAALALSDNFLRGTSNNKTTLLHHCLDKLNTSTQANELVDKLENHLKYKILIRPD